MKRILLILLVLFASSLVFAGSAQWWYCSAFLETQFRWRTVCAKDLDSAGMSAMAAGVCGFRIPSKMKEIEACVRSTRCKKTHRACVP